MGKNLINITLGIIMAALLFATPTENQAQSMKSKQTDGWSVMLPSQANLKNTGLLPVTKSTNKSEWKEFSKRNGKWQLSIDKITGTPRMAFGNPISIDGFEKVSASNIEQAALSFLKDNAKLFKIDINNIKISRKDFVNGKWYISFKQYYKDIELLLAGIELRINSQGKVFSFDIDYYNNINLDVNPSITPAAAMEFAGTGIETKSKINKTLASEKTYILPVKYSNKADCRLVYKVNVTTPNKSERYTTYVDAHKGDVVWRFSNIMKAMDFDVKGNIKVKNPNNKVTTEPMPNIYVKVGNQTLTANHNGIVSCNVTEPTDVTASLEGPWGKVITNGISLASYSGKITPGSQFSLVFDDKNSHRYERNMYYYLNSIHNFLTTIDPQLTCMDTQMVVKVSFVTDPMFGNSPNAYSAGDTIVFINCQNTSARMADGPSVLYHEYGHSVNTLFYMQRGRENGMVSATCHEAIADVTSAAILDEPEVGIGVFTADTLRYIRTLKNNLIFPDSVNGESHHDGQILSGAFWDLREKTSLELIQKLHHYARYGLPDDPNVGIAFYKWLIEVLIADDDDGNLANGTPNYDAIIQSFENHKIGASLFYTNNYDHTALDDTPNTTNPYKVTFEFGDDNTALNLPDSATVSYRIKLSKGYTEFFTVPAIKDGSEGLSYTAEIPPQKKFSEVQYFINVYFSNPNASLVFGNNSSSTPYDFLVGYKTALFDNYETESKWKTGSQDDDATVGMWERGKPFEVDFSFIGAGIIKPGNNHSANGEMYFSTGLTGVPQGSEDDFGEIIQNLIPDGKTTLTSPIYDLSLLEGVIFKYFVYFMQFKMIIGDPTFNPGLTTQISNDGGNSWVTVSEDTSSGIEGWVKTRFRFEDYLPLTSTCKIRFRYSTKPGFMGFPAALASASIDDFEILTANEGSANEVNDISNLTTDVHPNPFTGSVSISFLNNGISKGWVSIYNLQGQEVFSKELINENSFIWNGKDLNNNPVNSGVYIYKIISGAKVIAGKLIKQ